MSLLAQRVETEKDRLYTRKEGWRGRRGKRKEEEGRRKEGG
jgi:hypothetical protein